MITITASNRYDISALVEVRKHLEAGLDVWVQFTDGAAHAHFTPWQLPSVIKKLIYSV